MKYTEKLNLKKPDLEDYVKISDLNDNMDILDETVGSMNDDLESHKAEDATDAHLAKNIGIEDSEELFDSDNVEGALSELFTNVSDGKQIVSGAITDLDPSVVVPADPTFAELATAIGQISTGKKWALYTGLTDNTQKQVRDHDGNTRTAFCLTLSGLTFTPGYILAHNNGAGMYFVVFSKDYVYKWPEKVSCKVAFPLPLSTSYFEDIVEDNGIYYLPTNVSVLTDNWTCLVIE